MSWPSWLTCAWKKRRPPRHLHHPNALPFASWSVWHHKGGWFPVPVQYLGVAHELLEPPKSSWWLDSLIYSWTQPYKQMARALPGVWIVCSSHISHRNKAKKPYPASFWSFSFSIPTPSNHSSCGQATSLTKCPFDSTIFWMSSKNHDECNSRIALQVSTAASQSWWGFRSEECAHTVYSRTFYYKVFHLAKSNPLAPGTWAEPRLEAIWAHSVPELTGFTVDSIPQSWTARKLFESEGAHKDSKYI